MAACVQQADYGKQRLWGAVGWGICSALAGAAISHTGIWAAFAGHAVLAVVAAVPTARLPFGPLHAKLDRQSGRQDCIDGGSGDMSSGTAADGAAASAAAAGGKGAVERFDSATEAQALLSRSKQDGKPGGGGGSGGRSGGSRSSTVEQQGGAEVPPLAVQPKVHYWAGVGQLLSNPEASIFFVQALTMGFGVGAFSGSLHCGRLHCCSLALWQPALWLPAVAAWRCDSLQCTAAALPAAPHAAARQFRPYSLAAGVERASLCHRVRAGNIESYLFLFLDQLGADIACCSLLCAAAVASRCAHAQLSFVRTGVRIETGMLVCPFAQ